MNLTGQDYENPEANSLLPGSRRSRKLKCLMAARDGP
jgi:hypothetical protein